MTDFTIRWLSQRTVSSGGWLKVYYSDEYLDEKLWSRIVGNNDTVSYFDTFGITSLVRNADRIEWEGLHCKSRFLEAYEWCRDHGIKKVTMNSGDVEYAMAVCRGINSFPVHNCQLEKLFDETAESGLTRYELMLSSGHGYVYKNARGERWMRIWFEKEREKYEEAEGLVVQLSTMFNLNFDYSFNPVNGDKIFTFHR